MSAAFAISLMLLGQVGTGVIAGRVVNATRGDSPVADAEVYLQSLIGGRFEAIALAKSTASGQFLFEGIPLDQPGVYLAGAGLDGIHYPGPRVSLDAARPVAKVVVRVHETSTGPNPLILRGHDVAVVQEAGLLKVTESLRIENPQPATYVGNPEADGSEPVTLELRIPPQFERVTFHEEFYGRQFTLREGRLVTSLPWTPGARQFTFSYVMPDDGGKILWERSLDLPCDHLRISVEGPDAASARCNLGGPQKGPEDNIVFTSNGPSLEIGTRITLDRPRSRWLVRADSRWVALGILMLVTAATLLSVVRGRGVKRGIKPHHAPDGRRRVRTRSRSSG